MADLTTTTEIVEIATGVGGALIAIVSFYMKVVVGPEKKFKADVLKNINDLNINLEDYKKITNERIKDLEKNTNEQIRDFTKSLQDSDKYEQREIDDFREELRDLTKEMNDHINRVEAKNEKLLDLIIKYFTDSKE